MVSDGTTNDIPASGAGPAAEAASRYEGWIDSGTPEFRRVSWSLCAVAFAVFAILYFVQPLLPVFASEFAVSPAASSLLLSATTETLAFALLFSGPLSDRVGRKPVIMVSTVAAGVLTLLMAVAPSWGWLVATRVLLGVSLSGVQAVGMAYLAEEMRPRAFGLSVGLFIGGGVVGGMVARLVASLTVDFTSWRVAAAAFGVVALLAALAFQRFLPVSRNFHGRRSSLRLLPALAAHLTEPTLALLFVVAFLLMGGFITVFNYIPFRLVAPPFGLSQSLVGAVFLVYVCGIFSSAWVGNLASRRSPTSVFWAAVLVVIVGLALTLPDSLPLIVLGVAIFTFGFFGAHSVASGWVSKTADMNKALAASLYLFFYYQGSSIVGVFGGVFWSRFGWTGVAGLTGTMFVAALAIALVLRRIARHAG